jgi:hypothetical protein
MLTGLEYIEKIEEKAVAQFTENYTRVKIEKTVLDNGEVLIKKLRTTEYPPHEQCFSEGIDYGMYLVNKYMETPSYFHFWNDVECRLPPSIGGPSKGCSFTVLLASIRGSGLICFRVGYYDFNQDVWRSTKGRILFGISYWTYIPALKYELIRRVNTSTQKK